MNELTLAGYPTHFQSSPPCLLTIMIDATLSRPHCKHIARALRLALTPPPPHVTHLCLMSLSRVVSLYELGLPNIASAQVQSFVIDGLLCNPYDD